MRARLSILDLAPIGRGQSARESFAASVALARRAEELGYQRVWYAEHHNMPSIASSATPGRIDLGLGRAPGSDQQTTYALRRDPRAAEAFPRDVLELQAYLAGDSRVPGVDAIPGKGARVPLYILGSSLFGAQLAGMYGLPYAFASHFAPDALDAAIAAYRSEFKPSAQLDAPYVIAGVNVTAADTSEAARAQLEVVRRAREVGEYLDAFKRKTGADELIVVHQARGIEERLRSVTLTAEAMSV